MVEETITNGTMESSHSVGFHMFFQSKHREIRLDALVTREVFRQVKPLVVHPRRILLVRFSTTAPITQAQSFMDSVQVVDHFPFLGKGGFTIGAFPVPGYGVLLGNNGLRASYHHVGIS